MTIWVAPVGTGEPSGLLPQPGWDEVFVEELPLRDVAFVAQVQHRMGGEAVQHFIAHTDVVRPQDAVRATSTLTVEADGEYSMRVNTVLNESPIPTYSKLTYHPLEK